MSTPKRQRVENLDFVEVCEIARIALQDRSSFNKIAVTMDVSDDYLGDVLRHLEEYLGDSK